MLIARADYLSRWDGDVECYDGIMLNLTDSTLLIIT